MKTQGIEPELQTCIRKYFSENDPNHPWKVLANCLGITLKAVQYNLNPALGRDVTFNFIGLIAVFYPAAWKNIENEYIGGMK